jgi:hypothetical protein
MAAFHPNLPSAFDPIADIPQSRHASPMNLRGLIPLLLVTGCAAVAEIRPNPHKNIVTILTGDREQLASFERHARTCGVLSVVRENKRAGGYWLIVFGPTDWWNMPAYDCALADIPKGLYFVGNGPPD